MAQVPKRLGAITPPTATITTPTLLYTCVTTSAIVTTIAVCNASGSDQNYRLAIVAGTPDYPTSPDVTGYIIYNNLLPRDTTEFIPVGFTLDLNNKFLLCSASSTSVTFSAFGFEVS